MSSHRIYFRLPPYLQNLSITLYSYWIYSKKYPQLPEPSLIEDLGLPGREYLDKKFQKFIRNAISNVPFYRDVIRNQNIRAEEITLYNYKKFFPIVTKEDVRCNPELFYSEDSSEKITWLFTSGTSGSPLRIKSSLTARKTNYAFYQEILRRYGVELFSESATFAGRVLFSKVVNNCYWRRDSYLKTTYFSTYHMSNSSLRFYIEELEKRKPVLIDSYPSSLSILANYIIDNQIDLSFTPRLLLTSSESLTDAAREAISRAFHGAPLIDHYGCTEMAVMAYSDGNCYRFPPQYSLVEFIPLEDGLSKIICTGLVNDAMPLIRYDIGDVCYHGVSDKDFNQVCEKIVGREDDVIVTPAGKKIGRMDPVFKGISGIDKAQIVQEAINKLRINIVLQSNLKHLFNEEQLKKNIIERVGDEMLVEVDVVNNIPLTKSGKFRAVVSNI